MKRTRTLMAAAALCGAALSFGASAQAAGLNGVWQITRYTGELRTVDGQEPPLTPEAAAVYAQRRAAYQSGDHSFDPTMKSCASPGTPRIMMLPTPMELIVRPDYVTFLFSWNHMFRVVPVGKALATTGYPTAIGTAEAAVQGDSVSIRTDQFNAKTLLDAAGLPHSKSMVTQETYTLSPDGKQLRLRLRVEDDKTFTRPWEAEVSYRRLPGHKIQEDICLDRIARGEPAIVEPK